MLAHLRAAMALSVGFAGAGLLPLLLQAPSAGAQNQAQKLVQEHRAQEQAARKQFANAARNQGQAEVDAHGRLVQTAQKNAGQVQRGGARRTQADADPDCEVCKVVSINSTDPMEIRSVAFEAGYGGCIRAKLYHKEGELSPETSMLQFVPKDGDKVWTLICDSNMNANATGVSEIPSEDCSMITIEGKQVHTFHLVSTCCEEGEVPRDSDYSYPVLADYVYSGSDCTPGLLITDAPTSAPSSGPTSAPATEPEPPAEATFGAASNPEATFGVASIPEEPNLATAPTPAPVTPDPTLAPTLAPTSAPTLAPTSAPTLAPTSAPTLAPTSAPTLAPTSAPTLSPTRAPTLAPTSAPTLAPVTAAAPESSYDGPCYGEGDRGACNDACDACSSHWDAFLSDGTSFSGVVGTTMCCVGTDACKAEEVVAPDGGSVCCKGPTGCNGASIHYDTGGVCCDAIDNANYMDTCSGAIFTQKASVAAPEPMPSDPQIGIACIGRTACYSTDFYGDNPVPVSMCCNGLVSCYQHGTGGNGAGEDESRVATGPFPKQGPPDGSVVECRDNVPNADDFNKNSDTCYQAEFGRSADSAVQVCCIEEDASVGQGGTVCTSLCKSGFDSGGSCDCVGAFAASAPGDWCTGSTATGSTAINCPDCTWLESVSETSYDHVSIEPSDGSTANSAPHGYGYWECSVNSQGLTETSENNAGPIT